MSLRNSMYMVQPKMFWYHPKFEIVIPMQQPFSNLLPLNWEENTTLTTSFSEVYVGGGITVNGETTRNKGKMAVTPLPCKRQKCSIAL